MDYLISLNFFWSDQVRPPMQFRCSCDISSPLHFILLEEVWHHSTAKETSPPIHMCARHHIRALDERCWWPPINHQDRGVDYVSSGTVHWTLFPPFLSIFHKEKIKKKLSAKFCRKIVPHLGSIYRDIPNRLQSESFNYSCWARYAHVVRGFSRKEMIGNQVRNSIREKM